MSPGTPSGVSSFLRVTGDRTLNMSDPELVDAFQKVSSERNSSHDSSVFGTMRMKLIQWYLCPRVIEGKVVGIGGKSDDSPTEELSPQARSPRQSAVRARKIANSGYSQDIVRTQITA